MILVLELQPNAETLAKLAIQLNELILNSTKAEAKEEKQKEAVDEKSVQFGDQNVEVQNEDKDEEAMMQVFANRVEPDLPQRVILRLRRTAAEALVVTDEDSSASTKATPAEEADEQEWVEDLAVGSREILSVNKELIEKLEQENASLPMEAAWIQIDATDESNPLLYILSHKAAEALRLKVPKHDFNRYEKIVLHLPGVCANYVPTGIDAFNASDFEGIEIEGPIGVNISALEAAGVNLTELAETLRNDTEVDEILARTNETTRQRCFEIRTLGGSYILPVLQKNQYDAFSAPIVFQGSAVVVRFGIYIESMSNFQTSTMDYDMDIYLLMSWRDARLVNPYNKPILVERRRHSGEDLAT
ncbi:Neur-chan-LBD domain-containing protein [Aphelenchoides bicaudatus]|nr:Neur-chan-LBD domain-containing protein [Aphelenchoides bicaudatus]